MKAKLIVVMAASFMLLCGQARAVDDPSGTYAVKGTVGMSSCDDIQLFRTTNEQWLINPTNEGYLISVVGNKNTNLQYDSAFYSDLLYGRYMSKNMFGDSAGFVDVQLAFKTSKQITGMKAVVKKNKDGGDCVAVSKLEVQKIN